MAKASRETVEVEVTVEEDVVVLALEEEEANLLLDILNHVNGGDGGESRNNVESMKRELTRVGAQSAPCRFSSITSKITLRD